MNLKKVILVILSIVQLYACADYKIDKEIQYNKRLYYSSSGFALIYEDELFKQKVINRKFDNQKIKVMHNILKKNTPIKIINPDNSKVIETKVYKKANYPKIFNIVISKKISTILELDSNNPYVEIAEIKKNKTFVAKESNIFDEEKNVAGKAPVDKIEVNDLTISKTKSIKKKSKNNNYYLIIGDFYFQNSAEELKNELYKKIKSDKLYLKKITNNNYRLGIGPFKNFNALKETYISLNNLGFEKLDVYRGMK